MIRRAVGTDRLRVGEDGTLYLHCRHPKQGWLPRRASDDVHKEFPGTCIRWDDEYFEIVAVDQLQIGTRYTLAPWSESHTMRSVLDYDEASEAKRDEDRRSEESRQRKAAGFSLLAIVTGLLPAENQRRLESELGVSGYSATLISAIIPFLIGGASLIFFMASALGAGEFSFLYLIGIYFWIESLVRIGVALGQSRPIGSFPVVLVWEIVAVLRGQKPLRAPEPKLKWEPDEATLDRDAYTQRLPFLAFLAPSEQRLLSARYGFDWHARGKSSATWLLVFSVFVAAVTLPDLFEGTAGLGDLVTLLIMGYLIWEQIIRLQRIGKGEPAGSVLGAVVRPFCRGVLGRGQGETTV